MENRLSGVKAGAITRPFATTRVWSNYFSIQHCSETVNGFGIWGRWPYVARLSESAGPLAVWSGERRLPGDFAERAGRKGVIPMSFLRPLRLSINWKKTPPAIPARRRNPRPSNWPVT